MVITLYDEHFAAFAREELIEILWIFPEFILLILINVVIGGGGIFVQDLELFFYFERFSYWRF